MFFLIISLFLPIILYFGIIKNYSLCDGLEFTLGLLSIASIVTFSLLLVTAALVPVQVQGFKSNYQAVSITIDQARANEDVSKYERVAMIENIIAINKTIEKHRTFHDSIWMGVWYRKEIADLDYILFTRK